MKLFFNYLFFIIQNNLSPGNEDFIILDDRGSVKHFLEIKLNTLYHILTKKEVFFKNIIFGRTMEVL